MKKLLTILAIGGLAFAGPSIAAPILTDLPADAYIVYNGLDWAWAGPVSCPNWPAYNVLSPPELHPGWRYATEEEFLNRPDPSLFEALPNPAAAVPYWNSYYDHIDMVDAVAGFINRVQVPNNDVSGRAREMWYVRGAQAVPDAGASVSMLGLALAGLGLLRRKT